VKLLQGQLQEFQLQNHTLKEKFHIVEDENKIFRIRVQYLEETHSEVLKVMQQSSKLLKIENAVPLEPQPAVSDPRKTTSTRKRRRSNKRGERSQEFRAPEESAAAEQVETAVKGLV
jgi:hypothetical protein